jgi:polar amino acid transport system ATP-binding protein
MGFAKKCADTVLFMHHGVVWEKGPPSRLFNMPTTKELETFLKAVV